MSLRNIVLSGAITGHTEEANEYFRAAEKAVGARYPVSLIFNPTKLPKLPSWEAYMKICRMRINGWATDIVYIVNDYYKDSKGAQEERQLAKAKGLVCHVFKNGVLVDLPEGKDVWES
jgi:hypothetical protein